MNEIQNPMDFSNVSNVQLLCTIRRIVKGEATYSCISFFFDKENVRRTTNENLHRQTENMNLILC